jgi:hypothetical protein
MLKPVFHAKEIRVTRTNHRLALAAILLLECGCSPVAVHTSGDPSPALQGKETYAWTSTVSLDEASGDVAIDEAMNERIQSIADATLAQRGFRRALEDQADLTLSARARVETRQLVHDPEYAVFEVELVEVGVLTIELVESQTGETLWSGTGRSDLRTVAVGGGVTGAQRVESPQARSWPVESMVPAILDELPLASP